MINFIIIIEKTKNNGPTLAEKKIKKKYFYYNDNVLQIISAPIFPLLPILKTVR